MKELTRDVRGVGFGGLGLVVDTCVDFGSGLDLGSLLALDFCVEVTLGVIVGDLMGGRDLEALTTAFFVGGGGGGAFLAAACNKMDYYSTNHNMKSH